MFEKFDLGQKQILFQALKRMIDSDAGIGFHNQDQGHPFYAVGAKDGSYPSTDADGPDKNNLYKLLSELSRDFTSLPPTGIGITRQNRVRNATLLEASLRHERGWVDYN